jgi:hypothetical protein
MRPSLWDYVREAFNAKPIGMFLPPNWAMLAGFGLASAWFQQPGLLVLGSGVEIGYLLLLGTNARFQRFVAGKMSAGGANEADRRLAALKGTLPDAERRRHDTLVQRCQAILQQQFHDDTSAPGFASQSDSLSRLTWMYLRLLVTRQGILRVIRDGARTPGEPPPVPTIPGSGQVLRPSPPPQYGSAARPSLEQRLAELKRRLADPELGDDLRRSLEGQAELLEQRVARRSEADEKLAFLDAELTRIEEQVELIREQAVLSTDPEHLSRRIDEISATLGTTGEWIADQQKTIGAMDDLIAEPPSLSSQTRARESN